MRPSAADSENKAVAPTPTVGDQKPAQAPTSPAVAPVPAKSAAAPVEPAGSSLTGTGASAQEATEAPAINDRRKSNRPPVGGVEKRNSVVDRRAGIDRRVVDIGSPTGLERRRGPGRRREEIAGPPKKGK